MLERQRGIATLAPRCPGLQFASPPAYCYRTGVTILASQLNHGQFCKLTVATLVATALLGCAVGPDFKRPKAPTSAYSQPPQTSGPASMVYGGEVATDWYTLFHSDSLNAIVQEALRANPDLEGARHNLLAVLYEL